MCSSPDLNGAMPVYTSRGFIPPTKCCDPVNWSACINPRGIFSGMPKGFRSKGPTFEQCLKDLGAQFPLSCQPHPVGNLGFWITLVLMKIWPTSSMENQCNLCSLTLVACFENLPLEWHAFLFVALCTKWTPTYPLTTKASGNCSLWPWNVLYPCHVDKLKMREKQKQYIYEIKYQICEMVLSIYHSLYC